MSDNQKRDMDEYSDESQTGYYTLPIIGFANDLDEKILGAFVEAIEVATSSSFERADRMSAARLAGRLLLCYAERVDL